MSAPTTAPALPDAIEHALNVYHVEAHACGRAYDASLAQRQDFCAPSARVLESAIRAAIADAEARGRAAALAELAPDCPHCGRAAVKGHPCEAAS